MIVVKTLYSGLPIQIDEESAEFILRTQFKGIPKPFLDEVIPDLLNYIDTQHKLTEKTWVAHLQDLIRLRLGRTPEEEFRLAKTRKDSGKQRGYINKHFWESI